MITKRFFDENNSSAHDNKGIAERYDKEQSVYRTPVVDSTFVDEAQQARSAYELEQAKLHFIKLRDSLPDASCKEQFQDWVVSQSSVNQTNFTKAK
jgi:hypothetical protein